MLQAKVRICEIASRATDYDGGVDAVIVGVVRAGQGRRNDGLPAVSVPLQPGQEITELEIERAGFGVI